MKRRLCIAATSVMVAAGLIGAAPASAETIGETGGGEQCVSAIWADVTYVVPPSGGTITSFSYESSTQNVVQLDFLVLRPTGGSNYTVVGKTGPVTLAGTGAIETFPANILVQGGDILGFWSSTFLSNCARIAAAPGGLIGSLAFATDPSVGATVSLLNRFAFNLNLSANLTTGPTSKAQCKNGGWRSFGTFKNQGECVTLFDTGT